MGLNYVTERILASVLPNRIGQQSSRDNELNGEHTGDAQHDESPQDIYEQELILMLEQKHGKVSWRPFRSINQLGDASPRSPFIDLSVYWLRFIFNFTELQIVRSGVMHLDDNAGETVRTVQAHGLVAGKRSRKSCHPSRSVSAIRVAFFLWLSIDARFNLLIDKIACRRTGSSSREKCIQLKPKSFRIDRFGLWRTCTRLNRRNIVRSVDFWWLRAGALLSNVRMEWPVNASNITQHLAIIT